MRNYEKSYTQLSPKSKLAMRNHKRKRRREDNKFEDVSMIEGHTLDMSAATQSPQSQNAGPTGGQVRVSYDKHLPCLPQPHEYGDPHLAGPALGMNQICQTNTLSQPFPLGTPVRTQNHGGQGGPAQGNLKKMRPVGIGVSTDVSAVAITGYSGGTTAAQRNWNNSSQNSLTQKGPPPNPWKGVVIQGSTFPDSPVKTNRSVKPNKHIKEKIVPILRTWLANGEITSGMYGLIMVHAIKEGYYPDTRAYRYNNPGNVGNTDSGENKGFATVQDGLLHLKDYIKRVAAGTHSRYRIGEQINIKPYYSQEIANNPQYGLPPYLPGYNFTYTGQIDQYVKIYATGARAGNSYLSQIISYFNQEDLGSLTPESKIQDIILIA